MSEPYHSGTRKVTSQQTSPTSPSSALANPDFKQSVGSPRGVTEDYPIHHDLHPWHSDDSPVRHHGLDTELDAHPGEDIANVVS